MNNFMLSIIAIVVGVIAIIVGILYEAQVLGLHPTRAYIALGAGAILVIIGIVGLVMSRKRRV